MEIISKELNIDKGHPNVYRLFLAVYKSFMEVLYLYITLCYVNFGSSLLVFMIILVLSYIMVLFNDLGNRCY